MSFFKKIFNKKDDDIPEMHLQKNEPKPYYSKEHQCWLIPGKEKEMLEAIAKQKKDPPKKLGSTSQTQPSTSSGTRQKPVINRYAMIIPTDNITEQKSGENTEGTREIKENIAINREIIKNFTQNENLSKQIVENPRQIQGFKPEITNSPLKVQEAIAVTNKLPKTEEIQGNQNSSLERESLYSIQENKLLSNPVNKYIESPRLNISQIESNLRLKIEEEYIIKLRETEEYFLDQLDEAREEVQFCEENYMEEISILKNQLNNFIKENLELKIENEKASDELNFKQKEVEQYQALLDTYRKSLEETQEVSDMVVNSSLEENKSEDFVMIHHQVEKLEYDKLILNNELIETRRQISNLTLEKSILEYKLKELDESNNLNLERLKNSIISLEQKNSEFDSQNKLLSRVKENFEREAKDAKELRRNLTDLSEKKNLLNLELNNLRNLHDKMKSESNSQIQISAQLKNEVQKLQNNLEEKDFNYSKVIKELRFKLTELKNEIEYLKEKNEESNFYFNQFKEFQEKVSSLNQSLFLKENLINIYEENVLKIKDFVQENFDFTPNQDLNKINFNSFDRDICLIFKHFMNDSNSRIYERNLQMKEISLMTEEIKNLKIEVEILKDYKKDITLEMEKYKEQVYEIEDENRNLKSDLGKKENSITSLKTELQTLSTKSKNEITSIQNLIKNSNLEIEEKNVSIEKLNSDIEDKISTIEKLKSDNQEQISTIKKLNFDNEEKNSTIEKLNSENQEKISTIKKLNSDFEELNNTLEKLKAEYVEKSKNSSTIFKQQLTSLETELKKTKDNLRSSEKKSIFERDQKEIYIQKVSELESEINELNTKLEENKFTNDIQSGKLLQDLKDREEIFNNILFELDNLISSDLLSFNQEEIEEFKNLSFNSSEFSFPELIMSNKVRYLINLVEKYKIDSSLIKNELNLLKDELTRNQNMNQLLEKKINMLNLTVASLNSKLDSTNKERNHENQYLNKFKEEIQNLNLKINQKEDELKNLKTRITSKEEELKISNIKIIEKEEENKNLKINDILKDEEIQKFKFEIESLKKELNSLLDEKKTLQCSLVNLQEDFDKIRDELIHKDELVITLDSENKSLKTEVSALIKNKNNLLDDKSKMKEEFDESMKREKFNEEQITQLKFINNELQTKLESLSNQRQELKESFMNLKADYELFRDNTKKKEEEFSANHLDNVKQTGNKLKEKEKEIEVLKEKAKKLLELLEQTKSTYENALNTLKNKNKQKLIEIKNQIESLEKEKEDLNSEFSKKLKVKELEAIREISNLNEKIQSLTKLNIEHEESFKKVISNNLAIFNKYEIKNLNEKTSHSDIIKAFSLLYERLELEILNLNKKTKEKDDFISKKNKEFINQSSEIEALNRNLTILAKEKEALFENLSDKTGEIDELLNKISDIEIQNRNLQNSYDEVNKNHENLLKTHKSAEKMNELQKKIKHLIEEKSTLSQSNSLIVDSLTKEIKELNEKLNEYRRKERVEEIVAEVRDEVKDSRKQLIDVKNQNIQQSPINTESSSAERKEEVQVNKNSPQTPQNLGFFTRILAPIFLTEKELENIQKK